MGESVFEVVKQSVTAREAAELYGIAVGRGGMACCPFHKEKTPSFAVNPQKQFYKCYGCGKAGDAIRFIMEMEHLEFPEAVEKLAGIYGHTGPPGAAGQS